MDKSEFEFLRHPDDRGIDEILLCRGAGPPRTVEAAWSAALLRMRPVERYKTSGMSGDEWRFSHGLYLRTGESWDLLATGGHSLEAFCAELYPALYGDVQSGKANDTGLTENVQIGGIAFQWKGVPVYCASDEGGAVPLLAAAGHLPWSWILASEWGTHDASPLERLCCQPGCAKPHVSVYRVKQKYDRSGHVQEWFSDHPRVRGFCAKHLRRGDCGLDDADSNYEVLSGPGPGGHEPDPKVVTQSRNMGIVSLADLPDAIDRQMRKE